jgi:clan AA aspartic protease
MGLIYTTIVLRNPRDGSLSPIEVQALVDTGSMHLRIPEHVAIQLKLETAYEREATLADGAKKLCPYVGPVEVRFDGRCCFVGVLVLGEQTLLGAVPMEDMDLIVHPTMRTVVVNPKSPNIPSSIAM